MTENIVKTILVKSAEGVLNNIASLVYENGLDQIHEILEEKGLDKLDEGLHKELVSYVHDPVVLEAIDGYLAKIGIYPGNQINRDWYEMSENTKRIIDGFFSLHREWYHERISITPVLEKIIYTTYDTVLSCLSKENRILFLQAQKNSNSIRRIVDQLAKKIDDVLQSVKNSECDFNLDRYRDYLSDHQGHISNLSFRISKNGEKCNLEDVYICDDKLFKEIKCFLTYDWKQQLRKNLEGYETKTNFIVNSLDYLSSTHSMFRTVQVMEEWVNAAMKRSQQERNCLESIKQKISNTSFRNCMFISGCYGCGKTRLSLEFAKYCQNGTDDLRKTVFLFVESDTSVDIKNNIAAAFETLFSGRCGIDQYLNAFPRDYKLVIVLDDVHRYFQKGIGLEDIFKLIERYSRSYVKWILMTQPGYAEATSDLYQCSREEYSYQWCPEMREHLIQKWFPLDMWHRWKDTPGAMINQVLSISQWEWKDKVSSTNYYTPLFANILIRYHMCGADEYIFSKHDLLFPEFCRYFYHILAGYGDNIELSVKKVIRILLELHSLEFLLNDDTLSNTCNTLLNKGLLLKKTPDETDNLPYEGIPDIVWIYKLAMSMKKEWLDKNDGTIKVIASGTWKDNEKLFNDILSTLVQIAASDTGGLYRERMKTNWEQLLNSGCYQAVIESGFNCEPDLRNDLLALLLERETIWEHHFAAIMGLCALGEVRTGLLLKIIKTCVDSFESETVKHGYLFANMLKVNISTLSWKKVKEVFCMLCPIPFCDEVPYKIGMVLGTAFAEKADKVGKLQEAIEMARRVSKKKPAGNEVRPQKTGAYPSDVCDWFCAALCDTVIEKYEAEGYEMFCRKNWYVYNRRPEWEELHRNKALTFALSDHYRNSLSESDNGYVNWFEGLLQKLKVGTKKEKTFALYLIVHTGLKETGYRIWSGRLLEFAEEIIKNPSMRNVIKEKSIAIFIETNQIEREL